MDSIILTGFLASLAAGLCTAVGAIPILFIGRPTEQQQNVFLGFAAGVMLAASFFSLIIPGIAQAEELGATRVEAAGTIVFAVLLGAITLSAMNRFAPVEMTAIGRADAPADLMRRIWLFFAAVTLHNFPEGLAVGVSFGGGDMGNGAATAIGIGLQNMPEGLAVAASLMTLGYSRNFAFAAALVSGLVEPVGGLLGVTIVSLSETLLPWGLGFAAGAMIYVVASEIIPETQRLRPSPRATHGLMIGLVAMMFLDVTLG
jgi:zinc transporter, ZIP family